MSESIWTIGHSTRTQDDFLALLAAHRIDAIADVRRFPMSRRHPHFNTDVMPIWLEARGVAYRHFVDLGGRRSARGDSINTGLRHASFRGYADYMATPAFENALDALLAWAGARRAAVMCAEAVYWQCHRSLLADALAARAIDVRHILDAASVRAHKLHPMARVEDKKTVIYPGLL